MKSLPLFFFTALLSFSQKIETNQQTLIDRLFEIRDPAAFERAFLEASKAEIPQQTLIEARFLFLVDSGDQKALADYADTLVAQKEYFDIDDSLIFSSAEDYEAIVEYSLAVSALLKNERDAFKKHIMEAFWLSPSQSSIFGRLVDEERMRHTMDRLRIDLSRKISPQLPTGKTLSLSEHLGESEAIVLHFWSPWARDSMESMNDFFLTAKSLADFKIPAASILLAGTPESRLDADVFIKNNQAKTNAPWLLDFDNKTLASSFRINAFPTFILLSNEGKVRYNGHPGNPEFWRELTQLAPGIKRPGNQDILPELPKMEE